MANATSTKSLMIREIAKPGFQQPRVSVVPAGMKGGAFGGLVVGLIISPLYYLTAVAAGAAPDWWSIPANIIYPLLVGLFIGEGSTRVALTFHTRLRHRNSAASTFVCEIVGGGIGGAVGGVLIGVAGGLFFGKQTGWPLAPDWLVFCIAPIGAVGIVLGILISRYGKDNVVNKALLSLTPGVIACTLLFIAGKWVAMSGYFTVPQVQGQMASGPNISRVTGLPQNPPDSQLIKGGAIIGLVIGGLLGLQIGYTLWSFGRDEAAARAELSDRDPGLQVAADIAHSVPSVPDSRGTSIPTFQVFLSHNSKDKPIVIQLAVALKQRGISVWFDDWELRPGLDWSDAIQEIVQTCASAAICVADRGIGPWEEPEMKALLRRFVNEKQSGSVLPVIPVLLPGAPSAVKLPIFLDGLTWVDLRSGLTSDGLDRLQWGITGIKPDI